MTAAVGAAIVASPLPTGLDLVLGAAARAAVVALTGRDNGEPGPGTPDGSYWDSDGG